MATAATTSRRLISNTVWNLAGFGAAAVVGFVTVGVFLGRLGPARYGVWILVGSLFRYRLLLSLGLDSAINRFVPVSLARGDRRAVSEVVGTAYVFSLGVAGIIAAATFLLYAVIGRWFRIGPELLSEARALVLIVGLGFAVSVPLQRAVGVLSGLQRYDLSNSVETGFLLLKTAIVVLLLARGYGIVMMGLVFGAAEVLSRLVQQILSVRLLPEAAPSLRHFNRARLREMTGYGTNTLLFTLGTIIHFKAGDVLIGLFLGAAPIALFSIALTAVLLLSELVQLFAAAVKPAVSDLDARADEVRIRTAAFLTQKYILLLIIPATAFLTLLGREFLGIWVGRRFPDPASLGLMARIMTIFALGQAVRFSQQGNFIVLEGKGIHRVFSRYMIASAALFVVAGVICLQVPGLGLTGLAWANFVPTVVVSGFLLQRHFNRAMAVSPAEQWRRVLRPAALGTLPAVALIVASKWAFPPANWAGLGGVVGGAAALAALGAWLLALEGDEKARLRSWLTREGSGLNI